MDELDQAIARLRRSLYLEGLKGDYDSLAADPKAMADLRRKIALWDGAADDGLEGL